MNYKIVIEAKSEIRPEDIGGLLDYLLGGALQIHFLSVDKIGADE